MKIYDKLKGERMDINQILLKRIWNSHVFTCGPKRMIEAVIQVAKSAGMTDDELYYEIFSADSSGDPFSVEILAENGKVKLQIGQDITLLKALREAGLEVSSSCETSNCGTCRVPVRRGKIDHRGTGLTEEAQKNETLSCVSRGIGHIETELPNAHLCEIQVHSIIQETESGSCGRKLYIILNDVHSSITALRARCTTDCAKNLRWRDDK